jgi:5-amino-6-(5-phosphoribosylamino)uracil reductase/diaminohydroxyphosphoribosylaminopyrimidine deaminase/5-amino-6-(5-phosphoribosylamino)uracil reductase
VILDSRLRLPLDSTIVRTCKTYQTIVFTLSDPTSVLAASGSAAGGTEIAKRRAALERAGIEVSGAAADEQGRVSVRNVVDNLARRGFQTVFVEGGAQVITSFLRGGLVDRMLVVTAPLIIGRGVEAIGELGFTSLAQALRPSRSKVRRLGRDQVWELYFDGH